MAAPVWDPAQYHKYADQRLRPALELFARVGLDEPAIVHDVGCGRGDIARLAANRWPSATIIGSDVSAEMLEAAASVASRVRWLRIDVRDWAPPRPPDLIYANAVLHWVEDHEHVIPRLYRSLAPGGELAIQMPLTSYEPTFAAIRVALATGGTGGGPVGPRPLHERFERPWTQRPEWYHDLLTREGASLDLWTTRYYHVLEGDHPVFEWVKGAALRPIIAALDSDALEAFASACKDALAEAYPRRADGTTLLPYPRLFIVARRG